MHTIFEVQYHINLLITIFPSQGFSVGSQSSVAGYSQLPFPALVLFKVCLLCSLLGGWDAVSIVCLVLSKSGPIMLKISHGPVPVSAMPTHSLTLLSICCSVAFVAAHSFIHSFIRAVPLSVCFRCVAQIFILF